MTTSHKPRSQPIDWNQFDWSLSTRVLCQQFGVSQPIVDEKRREFQTFGTILKMPKRKHYRLDHDTLNIEALAKSVTFFSQRNYTSQTLQEFIQHTIHDAANNTVSPGFIGTGCIQIRNFHELWVPSKVFAGYLHFINQ